MRTLLRTLFRRPTFALLIVTTLGMGIAAATVVFSFAYGVLLSPLPYANASRMVLLWEFDRLSPADSGVSFGPLTTVPEGDFEAWRRQTRTLERLDALTLGFYRITEGPRPTEVLDGRVTPGFFATAGVQPLLGRTFAPGDPEDVMVLGYGAMLIGAGLLLGTGASLLLTRVLKSVLYGVQPIDPPTFVTAAAVLAACSVPALRASAVDPMHILRDE